MPSIWARTGWAGPAAVAAGLVALAGTLRRTHQPGMRRRPANRVVETDLALRTNEYTNDIDWVYATLCELAEHLQPNGPNANGVIRAVQLTSVGLDVLWTARRDDTPDGWEIGEPGWVWHRPRHLNPAQVDAPPPAPALVTVGRTCDGDELLINLEAHPYVHLTGDVDQVDATMATLITELAVTPIAERLTVLTVGYPITGDTRFERVEPVDLPTAIDRLERHAAAMRARLDDQDVSHVQNLRVGGVEIEGWEPVLVIADTADHNPTDIRRLIDACQPGTGALAALVGSLDRTITGGWTLDCQPAATTVVPLELAVIPRVISPEFELRLAELLDDATLPDPAEPTTGAVELSSSAVKSVESWDIEFRVLGQVDVLGAVRHVPPKELELGVYLALHPGQTSATIRAHVWPKGGEGKTFRNVCNSLRRALGCDADGNSHFPSHDKFTYRLGDRVTTDWHRFQHLIDTDRPGEAARLIRGPAFRADTGYDWAFSELLAQHIDVAIERATTAIGTPTA